MAKRKKLTPEEEKKARLQRELNDCIGELIHCSEPTYRFSVGDKVSIGNLLDATITETLKDNKIYKICYSIIHENYGNPF